uniref:Uncharacterized protein n=1 Tax=Arundo donax TaxID=35708 RepID=A0A0A9CC55_ARUDO
MGRMINMCTCWISKIRTNPKQNMDLRRGGPF